MERQVARKGYKQTELGEIPEDWGVVSLLDAVELHHGKAHEQFVSNAGDYVVVNSKFVSTGGKVRKFCTQNFSPAKTGDVLMVLSDLPNGKALAKCFLAKVENRYAVNQRVCVFRVKRGDPAFYFYRLNRHKYFLGLDDGVTQTHILNGDIAGCSVVVPRDVREQAAIANALSDTDALITSLEKLIDKKRAIKTAAMQQLLTGKKRLPGFDKHPNGKAKGIQQTELGEIPEDWEIEPLERLVRERPKYGINAAAVPLLGSVPVYIRITDINDEGYFRPTEKVGVDSPFSDEYKLEEGDIVVARTGASVGKSYLYRKEDGELIYAGFLIKLSPGNQLSSNYLFQYFRTEAYWNWVTVMSTRSGQPGINGREYGQQLVPVPTLEEQTAIANALSDMDRDIEALQDRLEKTQQIKQGMMQELLTGRVRLV